MIKNRSKKVQNDQKWVKKGPTWSKIAQKRFKMVENRSKKVQHGQKWANKSPKWSKMSQKRFKNSSHNRFSSIKFTRYCIADF